MKTRFSAEEQDAILSSMDNAKRAEAPAYFYTRLVSRMESEKAEQPQAFFKRGLSVAVLAIFLLVNCMMIINLRKPQLPEQTKTSGLQEIALEYSMGVSTVYDSNQEIDE